MVGVKSNHIRTDSLKGQYSVYGATYHTLLNCEVPDKWLT
jgi:hypothetical protein